MKERKEKKKAKLGTTLGLIGLIAVMSSLIVVFSMDFNQEPNWLVDVISEDPYNYLEKRTNLNDGTVHYHFNYTERMGTSSP